MPSTILVLNGPNLNLLGLRQPEIYGAKTLADVEAECRAAAERHGLAIDFRQSNAEHELIGWIHEAREGAAAVIINPAAYSHTSVAIMDALKMFEGAIVEVHISNIHKREPFRHHSYMSAVASAVIAGCGTQGYSLAVEHVASLLPKA